MEHKKTPVNQPKAKGFFPHPAILKQAALAEPKLAMLIIMIIRCTIQDTLLLESRNKNTITF